MNSTKYHSLFPLYKLLIHLNNVRICAHCNVPVHRVVGANVQGCLLSGPLIPASHRHTPDTGTEPEISVLQMSPGVRLT